MTPTLFTDRLILRPFKIEDANAVRELAGDREVSKFTLNIPYPYKEGMAEKWIQSHASAFKDKGSISLAITLKDETLIGAISLHQDARHNRAELGFWIGRDYWGNGYCTEAAKAVVTHGFESLGLHKITSQHFVQNQASGKVLEKIGMTAEGLLKDEVRKDGKYYTLVTYGMLRNS